MITAGEDTDKHLQTLQDLQATVGHDGRGATFNLINTSSLLLKPSIQSSTFVAANGGVAVQHL